jgi:hypothetical protein
MATERRREAPAIPQFLNEVVAENDLILGYCRNPFTPDIMAQELPVGFQFAKKLDDYDGTKDPFQHVQNFERIDFPRHPRATGMSGVLVNAHRGSRQVVQRIAIEFDWKLANVQR